MTYGGKAPLVEGADVRVVRVAVIVTDIVWVEIGGGVEVRLREAQGPVVLETVEDVRDELGGRRVRRPSQAVERRVLRLGVAAHVDGVVSMKILKSVKDQGLAENGWPKTSRSTSMIACAPGARS